MSKQKGWDYWRRAIMCLPGFIDRTHLKLVLNKCTLCLVTCYLYISPSPPFSLSLKISSARFSNQIYHFYQAHCLFCSAFSTPILPTCSYYKADTGQCPHEGTHDGFPMVPHNVNPMDVETPLPLHRSVFEMVLCGRCGREGKELAGQLRWMLGTCIMRPWF